MAVEYFSGLDVAVSGYVNDRDKIIPLDCHSIQFSYENPKSPIYGHSNNIMSTKMQGTTLVQGALVINLSHPQNLKAGLSDTFARSGTYFDVDIKSYRMEGNKKVMNTFEEAYAEARQLVGAGKTFRFKGKTYSTSSAEELKGGVNVSWGQFMYADSLDLKLDFRNSSKFATSEAELTMVNNNPEYEGTINSMGLYIKDVQFTGRGQSVTPSPDNILENYQFIARNVEPF